MYTEDDLIPLSAVQHLLFRERQCALIHVEQMWNESLFTAEGRIMHERIRSKNKRPYWITLRTNKARHLEMIDQQKSPQLNPPHGGYRELQSYQRT